MKIGILLRSKLIYGIILLFTQGTLSKSPPLTIMIHGTSRTTNFFEKIPSIHRIFSEWLRTPNGLHHASLLSKTHNFVQIAQTLHKADPEMFDLEHFYFFGWRGYLCPIERMQAGGDIFAFLNDLVKKECYKDSPITIITHSHGGNVALSLAHYLDAKGANFTIERLILLACPVQDSTENYAASPLFKHIHNLFSATDWMQILDPQGLRQGVFKSIFKTTFFSRRTFKKSLPVNNIKLFNHRKGLGHVNFIKPDFYVTLPTLIHALESQNLSSYLETLSPQLHQADLAKIRKRKSEKSL